MADLDKCSSATGEAYSIANLGNDLYIASYPGTSISVYDPFQPYHFGNQPEHNPRDIGRVDDISYRPRSTLTGPLGRVWLASLPDYGRSGGLLSYYDPATEEKKVYYQVCGDASCYTLAHLPQQALIAVSTSISGGSDTQPKASQVTLFLWDYHTERKAWEGTLDRNVSFNALVTGADGKLYGTVKGRRSTGSAFVFEPEYRTFTHLVDLLDGERALDLGLQNGPDGKIYGMTSSTIYRLNPTDVSVPIEPVIASANGFDISGPILENEIYYAEGHRLMVARIFE